MLEIGSEVPSAQVARLAGDIPSPCDIRELLCGHKTLLIGVPQAFTPVCSQKHIPDILASLERLRHCGFTRFIVIAPDNPWAMDAWKAQFPGAEEILFLSDGNGDFVKACGLEESCKGLFLGECSRRYAIQMQDTIVISLAIEDSILTVECTGALDQIAAADGDDAPIIEFVEG